jgi:hypothetical protein
MLLTTIMSAERGKNETLNNDNKIFYPSPSVADPDPGSGIRGLFDPWTRIRDPE